MTLKMTLKVIEGKDGMLFLDNDSNGVMRQITGEMKAGRQALAAIQTAHAERRALCRDLGLAYRHVICPNKESIETSRLPDRYRYESRGPTFVAQYLAAAGAEAPFYARDVLLGLEGAYYRTDSHWTDSGALAYLRAALASYGDARALARLDAMGAEEVSVERFGDLGRKLDWPPEQAIALRLTRRSFRVDFETPLANEGYLRLARSEAPDNRGHRALVLHDSFTTPLYRFLGECYGEVLFLHTPDLDARFLARFRPDVLWFIQAERFLPRAPRNDLDYEAYVAACEARKGHAPAGSRFLRETWPAARA